MLRKLFLLCLGACLFLALNPRAGAQSITSGDVTGTITDPSGAGVPNAAVTLTNTNTNVSANTTTNQAGNYRFAFVQPGTYSLSVTASGFQQQQRTGIVVTAGQPVAEDLRLQIASATQTVEVSEATEAVQTENADVSTSYNAETILNMPNPGGDLTYIAQTAPGVVMNTQSGYGNFSSTGLPGTSNQFLINGTNFTDPFLSLNNSGASNLMLGSNDIAEANVVSNAYSAQYGQYAGAQVVYTTKSGTNAFHGDAIYNWNGRAVNANQFFSNQSGLPTPFNNFNQWQTNLNGPIWKNHTFFDVDYEGIHNLYPTAANLNLIPSPQFQAATLTNLVAQGLSSEIPFYKQLFAVYNGAPGASVATPAPDGGCGGFTSPLLGSAPCALQFRSTPASLNTEYQWAARVDHAIGANDRFYIRVWRDNGFQPTYTSPFGSVFNDISRQPQMAGQLSETHTFGANTVNQFNASTWFYAAVFEPSNPTGAAAALPTFMQFADGSFTATGVNGEPGPFFFPQGRRVFQTSVVDDLSHVMGKHTFRAGFSLLHDIMTDLDFQGGNYSTSGAIITSLPDFFNGGGPSTSLQQSFPSANEEGIRFQTIAGYLSDDWKATGRLTVSLNLRLEHYSNPTCDANCFSRLANTFTTAPNPNAADTPYNQMILSGQHYAYQNTQTMIWEPRVGIAWRPYRDGQTVIRAGAGVFADEFLALQSEYAAFNSPGLNAFTVAGDTGIPFAPGIGTGLFAQAAQANQALLSQFRNGGSFNSISASVPAFSAPNFFNFPSFFPNPEYYKWNFQVERGLGQKTVLTLNYSGMHGIHIPINDSAVNAYCPPSVCPNGFAGLPASAPNPAFAEVQQFLSAGVASYNGLTVSLQRRLSAGFTFNLNYTYSHALDTVSNGGVQPFGALVTNSSILAPQDPNRLQASYGNSDYDVRHYFSATFVLTDMFRHAGFKWGPSRIFGGWTLSSNWFYRTGLPFTIEDGAAAGALAPYNYNGGGASFRATPLGPIPHTCTDAVNSPCLTTTQFAPNAGIAFPAGFGTIGRNSIYGPHFFDVDAALMKDVKLGERVTFSFGAQAYNLFNHPNFDQPVANLASPNFGSIINTVSPPTSILGSFLGAGGSPRFVEIRGLIRF
ncbi:MAG TPA: carboxypeptidase regulatory-like domain-containing protein [Bryobacteraceae bacterium]|nr:carboxypeptidase regulatory-like domain-containing protein [Bryobacteraceae bacterium]